MKAHLNPDTELVAIVREGLKRNDGYCPCIFKSKGKIEYRCMCKDFLENVPAGSMCNCGLYIKDEQ